MRKKIIRLRRRGSVRAVCFEIIITFKDRRLNGSGFEKLGFINTLGNSRHYIAINCERVGFWLNKGALLHPSVKYYLSKIAQ